MAKLSNLLVMIELLKNGRKYSLEELSTRLEVSKRTIREYKLFLEEAGIYIDTIMGPYGGYVLRQEVNIPSLSFNEKDLSNLKSMIKTDEDKEKLQSLIDKLDVHILNEENKNNNLNIDNPILDNYNKLSKALKYNLKVRITYYNLQHGVSIRTIYPLALYKFQDEWWVSSYWEEKGDMRQFHLVRIQKCEVLMENFNPQSINIKF